MTTEYTKNRKIPKIKAKKARTTKLQQFSQRKTIH